MASAGSETYGRLIVISRQGTDVNHFNLQSTVCIIGKSSDCDIRISLPGVAGQHCQLEVNKDRQVFLVNRSRKRPVLLNKEPLLTVALLHNGDTICVADRIFRFEKSNEAPKKNLQIKTQKRKKPSEVAKEYILACNDQAGLREKFINMDIGRGVFAEKSFNNGDFLLQYAGVLYRGEEASTTIDTDYTYHFNFKRENYCIDATKEPTEGPQLCRLVNHGDSKKERNATMKVIDIDGDPYLCLFSTRSIEIGEEIRYDYGVKNLPWQVQRRQKDQDTLCTRESDGSGHSMDQVLIDQETVCPRDQDGSVNSVDQLIADQDTICPRDPDGSVHLMDQDQDTVCASDPDENVQSIGQDQDTLYTRDPDGTMESMSQDQDTLCTRDPDGTMQSMGQDQDTVCASDPDGTMESMSQDQDTVCARDPDENVQSMGQYQEKVCLRDQDGNVNSVDQYEDIVCHRDPDGNVHPMGQDRDTVCTRDPNENVQSNGQDQDTGCPRDQYGRVNSVDQLIVQEDHSSDQLSSARNFEPNDTFRRQLRIKKVSGYTNEDLDDEYTFSDDDPDYKPSDPEESEEEMEDEEENVAAKKYNKTLSYHSAIMETKVGSKSQVKRKQHSEPNNCRHKNGASILFQDEGPSQDDDSDASDVSVVYPEYTAKAVADESDEIGNSTLNTIDEGVIIQGTTAYKEDGRRNVNKLHKCIFCGKLDMRIARHLRSHSKEDVIKDLEGKTKRESDKILDQLRKEGDYKHNIKVLAENKGFLILPRRPSQDDAEKYSYEDYLPCHKCKGFFLKHNLWRHNKKCKLTNEHLENPKMKTQMQKKGAILLHSTLPMKHIVEKEFNENVLSSLIHDEVAQIIKNDNIILKVGMLLYDKLGLPQRSKVNQDIRLLGRLVKIMRLVFHKENGFMSDFLKPANFDGIIKAVRMLAQEKTKGGQILFEKPSNAKKCGPALMKCCDILMGEANRTSNEEREKEEKRLENLLNKEWKYKISAIVSRSEKEIKRNQPVLLPITEDLKKLNKFLDAEIKRCLKEVNEQPASTSAFQCLQKAVLSRLISFNKRRSGEASKMLLEDYLHRPIWQDNLLEEMFASLSSVEKKLVNRLDMIAIRGKRDRPVCVILTPEIKAAVDVLVETRDLVHIDKDNPFLFPRGDGLNNIRGDKCLKESAMQASLEFPERISSTNLRKYTATVVQMLNLNAGEIEWISNHLGHTVEVHKEYYRNQEPLIELGKVAKTLIAVDRGQLLKKGDSEELPDDDVVDSEEDDEEGNVDDSEDENDNELPVAGCNPTTEIQENFNTSSSRESTTSAEGKKHEAPSTSEIKKKTRTKKITITRWSDKERDAINRQLKGSINLKKIPRMAECQKAINCEPDLSGRGWKAVKYYCYNQILKKQKK